MRTIRRLLRRLFGGKKTHIRLGDGFLVAPYKLSDSEVVRIKEAWTAVTQGLRK